MASHNGSKKVVYAALTGNFAIALAKFAAALWTGSSAMVSEGVHSLTDTCNQFLLLYGLHRASRPADSGHPLGHGRELYFWSFIVALLIFAVGAGISFYEGVIHISRPEPIHNPNVTYVVLAISFIFEGITWWIALREFRSTKGDLSYFQAIRQSKDPTTFTVLFEDSAALVGLAIAFAGIVSAQLLDMPVLDGVASLGISVVLGLVALILARESKGLLIGEAASPELQAKILRIAANDKAVGRANGVLTVHLGPEQIVVNLSVEFVDSATANEIEMAVERIEGNIKLAEPWITAVFVKPQRAGTYLNRSGPAPQISADPAEQS